MVKSLYILILLSVMGSVISWNKHEEHYSLTQIQYKESEKTLQITMKVFTEDMAYALQKEYTRNFEVGTERENPDLNSVLENYLKLKFGITLDGTLKNYTFVGKEFEKDAMFIYFEINDVAPFKKMELKNTLFLDSFSGQENLIKVQAFNTSKSLILNKQKQMGVLNYEL